MNLHWPDPDSLPALSDHQRSELRKAFAGPLSILTGGPGTGKSHSFGSIVRVLADKYGPHVIGCASPFSKAAQVMSEYLESKSIPIRATTTSTDCSESVKPDMTARDGDFIMGQPIRSRTNIYSSMNGVAVIPICVHLCSQQSHLELMYSCWVTSINYRRWAAEHRYVTSLPAGLPTGRLAECWRNSGIGERCCQEIAAGRAFIHASGIVRAKKPGII